MVFKRVVITKVQILSVIMVHDFFDMRLYGANMWCCLTKLGFICLFYIEKNKYGLKIAKGMFLFVLTGK